MFLCMSLHNLRTHLLVFDPLELPLYDHLSQVNSQLPLLYGHAGGEAQTLHGTDHVLHQVVAHRVVHLEKRVSMSDKKLNKIQKSKIKRGVKRLNI